ncbi:protocatechuate 3,4-dioxygenase [Flavobacterium sp. NPDC079362]|uniref:protocatechuate 3,4-dioxygenase n=1 Tax=Flavobacterium sp. NPDC079362 TaxID=3390566 RepID=UPI003D044A4C
MDSEYGGTSMQPKDYTSVHFLRGRQTTNSKGEVSFISIFPGWYQGRAPHVHIEVLSTNGASLLVTQIAFPETVSSTVYSSENYVAHGQADTSNTRDNVFSDSLSDELATLTGNLTDGYTLSKTITVNT